MSLSASRPLSEPPERARSGDTYAWGRYRRPIPLPNLKPEAPPGLGQFRLKEWQYVSLATDRWFVAFALVQLGYLANGFCYVVDRENPSCRREWEGMAPLGMGLSFASSSVAGTTRWSRGQSLIRSTWHDGWEIEFDLKLDGTPLRGIFSIEPAESLALLCPLDGSRPAYTHKAAGLTTRGQLRIGKEMIDCSQGLACLDWTRSVASRQTSWKWASLAARDGQGRRVGLNLSAEVYDDVDGQSLENALWLNGKVQPLAGVLFDVPAHPEREPWRIRSARGEEVVLEFRPLGARAQEINLGILRSDFIQPYGTFHGTLRPKDADPVTLEGDFGVVEDHLSLW